MWGRQSITAVFVPKEDGATGQQRGKRQLGRKTELLSGPLLLHTKGISNFVGNGTPFPRGLPSINRVHVPTT